MKFGIRYILSVLVMVSIFVAVSCDELTDTIDDIGDVVANEGSICLNDLLDKAGTSRSELGDAADAVVRELISLQADFLGESVVIDCEAKDTMESLSDDPGGSSQENAPEAEKGVALTANNAQEVPGRVEEVVEDRGGDQEDVVILIDTTGSMVDDAEEVAANIDSIIAEVKNDNGRLGVAWYGDNQMCDNPWYGNNQSGLVDISESQGESEIENYINNLGYVDGCNWPESMYDALWETSEKFQWQSTTKRMIILITDATPLTPPDSNHSESEVKERLGNYGITLHSITVGISY